MKTELTKAIERALKYYSPNDLGGIKLNKFRGCSKAFEVYVDYGDPGAGIIDHVRIDEYFAGTTQTEMCRMAAESKQIREAYRNITAWKCKRGAGGSVDFPSICNDECVGGVYRRIGTVYGTPSILISCFEIKVSKADFHRKTGHNFVGNLNYYVMPYSLYKEVQGEIPDHIGVVAAADKNTGSLRRVKNAEFREMTDEAQKWLILSVLKRTRRSGE